MALSIKNPHTEELARELAATTGESLTEAVTVAVEERLARLGQGQRRELQKQRALELLSAIWELPDLDTRSVEEILDFPRTDLPLLEY